MKDYKEIISKKLEEKDIGLSSEEIYKLIEIPPQEKMGDYSFPCFQLAKTLRKNPALIATEMASTLELEDFAEIKNVGPYINFFLDRKKFENEVINTIIEKKENFGKSGIGKGKTAIVEFSSVNIAKPFHIGHIRSTVIGDALRNIHEFLGYNTIATNYIGDYGTQFGTMIAAYKLWGDDDKLKANPIQELLDLYVISFNEFDRVYNLLDIDFDNYKGEAYYSKYMPEILEELKEKNLLVESDGAQIIDLSDFDLPPSIIIKSNGSSAYITRDIATAINRKKEYNFDENLYVVATQQNLHFEQLWKILELMGYDLYKGCKHISFGMVSLKDQTLSTRKGQVVFLEDVLNKAIEKTREIMENREDTVEDIDEVSRIVGIGAVKFQELYNNRIKDYVFDWNEVLNFEGESGPYVQYTYARAKSVLRKAGVGEIKPIEIEKITNDEEFSLVKKLAGFEDIVIKAKEKYEPSLVTRHLTDIAKSFNKFYNSAKIMVEDEKLKEERLALAYATAVVIKTALGLLGIKTVEKM